MTRTGCEHLCRGVIAVPAVLAIKICPATHNTGADRKIGAFFFAGIPDKSRITMNILAATPNDHLEIVRVWEASVRATHDFLSEADIQFFKPLILNEYLVAVQLFCAKDEAGKIHGFVGVAEGNIEMLFLAPRSRGKGLGKLLLNFVISELGASKVDVNEQNPSAVGFYGHMGFKVVGRSPVDGSGKPFPLLHMELESE